MKRRILFFLVAMFLVSGISKTMAQTADLRGIWQMCFYVSGDPSIPGELKPSNSFKILTDDGKFINMTMIPNKGAIIIGSGTYKQTAPNAFTEHVEKNLHLPQWVGVDNVLEYEMKGKLQLNFQMQILLKKLELLQVIRQFLFKKNKRIMIMNL